jgi:hypothetical protein
MADTTKIPVLLNYGGAKKSSFEMSSNEFREASAAIKNRAKEKAFSKGLPVYIVREGDIIAEFPDGRLVVVTVK